MLKKIFVKDFDQGWAIIIAAIIALLGTLITVWSNIPLSSTKSKETVPTFVPTVTPTDSNTIFSDDFDYSENLKKWYDPGQPNALWVGTGFRDHGAVQISNVITDTAIYIKVPNVVLGKSYQATVQCQADPDEECKLWFGDLPWGEHRGYSYDQEYKIFGNFDWQKLSVCLTQGKEVPLFIHIYAELPDTDVLYDDLKVFEVNNC